MDEVLLELKKREIRSFLIDSDPRRMREFFARCRRAGLQGEGMTFFLANLEFGGGGGEVFSSSLLNEEEEEFAAGDRLAGYGIQQIIKTVVESLPLMSPTCFYISFSLRGRRPSPSPPSPPDSPSQQDTAGNKVASSPSSSPPSSSRRPKSTTSSSSSMKGFSFFRLIDPAHPIATDIREGLRRGVQEVN